MMANWRRTGVILFALVVALGAFALGCDDDDGTGIGPPTGCIDCPPPPKRDTPENLLMNWFEQAYSERDSILYAEMLCDPFTFEFLVPDADSLRDVLGPDNFWGRALDLRSTGALFRSNEVTGITLNILVLSNDPYYADACYGCRLLDATVTLRIATTGDGTEPLIFTVDSPQTFVTKPALGDSTLWCLLKQIDRPRSVAKRDGSMTPFAAEVPAAEQTTWGKIKGIFSP